MAKYELNQALYLANRIWRNNLFLLAPVAFSKTISQYDYGTKSNQGVTHEKEGTD